MARLDIIEDSELKVPPLTTEERKWRYQMAQALRACPKRLEFMTTGDQLLVVDHAGARKSDLHNGAAHEDGVVLALLPGPICHGVC